MVYSGAVTVALNSWVEISFIAPFNYNGTSNLLIAVDENTPGFSCTAIWSSYTAPGNQGLLYRADGINPDPASPPSASTGPISAIAQIQFEATLADCLPVTGVLLNPASLSELTASWIGNDALFYNYELRTSGVAGSGVDGLVYSGNTIETSLFFEFLAQATSYQFYVQSVCESSISNWAGPFNSIILLGDVCATAIDLNSLVSPYNGTTASASSNYSGPCNAGNASPDLIYYIEVLPNAILTIGQTVNGYDSEIYLGYGDACPGAMQIACFDDLDIQNIIWTNNTGITQTVYWVQDGYFNNTNFGTFTLAWNLSPPPACLLPSSLTVNVTSLTTATINWNAPNPDNVNGYEYFYSTSNTQPVGSGIFTGATSVLITDIISGTTYYTFVRSDCGNELYSAWVGPISFAAILGNTCDIAIDLSTLTSPFSGTTVSATHEFSGPCNGGNTSPELFYFIEVPFGSTLEIGQTVNAYDSEIYVGYSGACPGENQIACFDDPDVQIVSWTNTTGESQTVFWVQDGFFGIGNVGTFTLSWTLIAAPIECYIPENVSAVITSVSNQEVSLSWTAPAEIPAVGYEYVVSAVNATPIGTGVETTETSVVVGVNAYNTSYYVFVRSNCGDGIFSDWTLSTSFLIEPTEGCIDTQACNYDDAAMEDDGSCIYEVLFYLDSDGDGYGDLTMTSESCEQPQDYVSNNTDCDDSDDSKWQSAELFIDVDSDGYDIGLTNVCFGTDAPEGYSIASFGTDCNDDDNTRWQTALLYVDEDGDGYNVGEEDVCYGADIPQGYSTATLGFDCNDIDNMRWQSSSLYIDLDGDGYDNSNETVCYGAEIPEGYILNTLGSDCNDNDITKWNETILNVTLDLGISEPLCSNYLETADLTGGLPIGGNWSGIGIDGSTFNSSGLINGIYTITYTVEGDDLCIIGGSAEDEIEVVICAGINELPMGTISLYPSITAGSINIRSEIKLSDAVIMDSFGRTINTISINSFGTEFSLENYATGVYLIRVNSPNGQQTFRVVKVN